MNNNLTPLPTNAELRVAIVDTVSQLRSTPFAASSLPSEVVVLLREHLAHLLELERAALSQQQVQP